jgi:hypothetical protein
MTDVKLMMPTNNVEWQKFFNSVFLPLLIAAKMYSHSVSSESAALPWIPRGKQSE